jgi:hypothetical protein
MNSLWNSAGRAATGLNAWLCLCTNGRVGAGTGTSATLKVAGWARIRIREQEHAVEALAHPLHISLAVTA